MLWVVPVKPCASRTPISVVPRRKNGSAPLMIGSSVMSASFGCRSRCWLADDYTGLLQGCVRHQVGGGALGLDLPAVEHIAALRHLNRKPDILFDQQDRH